MASACFCGTITSSDLFCLECGKPICSQCAVRVLHGVAIRLYHYPCEKSRNKLASIDEFMEDYDEGPLMGEGQYMKPDQKFENKRRMLFSKSWEDRIEAVKGVEELWFQKHNAEALGLYIRGMNDRSKKVQIAFLTNFEELFENRNNIEKRLQFIRDISKNPTVGKLLSTISKLMKSKHKEVKQLATQCLLITMEIISPGFVNEFHLVHSN